jgi:hypothetical protein
MVEEPPFRISSTRLGHAVGLEMLASVALRFALEITGPREELRSIP